MALSLYILLFPDKKNPAQLEVISASWKTFGDIMAGILETVPANDLNVCFFNSDLSQLLKP